MPCTVVCYLLWWLSTEIKPTSLIYPSQKQHWGFSCDPCMPPSSLFREPNIYTCLTFITRSYIPAPRLSHPIQTTLMTGDLSHDSCKKFQRAAENPKSVKIISRGTYCNNFLVLFHARRCSNPSGNHRGTSLMIEGKTNIFCKHISSMYNISGFAVKTQIIFVILCSVPDPSHPKVKYALAGTFKWL